MSYFFTKVPIAKAPMSVYHLTDSIALKPGSPTAYQNYMGPGSAFFLDTIFFISSSQLVEEHIAKLKRWVMFHSFILSFGYLCDWLENGLLQDHKQANSIDEIQENGGVSRNPLDFDDIGVEIYSSFAPEDAISYKTLYQRFEALQNTELHLLQTYLLQIEQRYRRYRQYEMLEHSRQYWQVAIYASILEAIIGHAGNCSGGVITCPVCNKRLQPHRQGSEREWREAYLSHLITEQVIKDQYLAVINAAYNEIRHPTSHAGLMPTPTYLLSEEGVEFYDTERSIREFGTDQTALDSLQLSVSFVTKYLLLNKLFQLNTFPRLPTLQHLHMELARTTFIINEGQQEESAGIDNSPLA